MPKASSPVVIQSIRRPFRPCFAEHANQKRRAVSN